MIAAGFLVCVFLGYLLQPKVAKIRLPKFTATPTHLVVETRPSFSLARAEVLREHAIQTANHYGKLIEAGIISPNEYRNFRSGSQF